ncbi:hypothetical protein Tco_1116824 [Tanacetum coccineum]
MLTKPQAFYDECHKTALGYQNPLYLTQAQRKVPALYCGNIIVKQHDALFVIDTEETLELAKESRLKMHAKQNDPRVQEKKVNIAPIDFVALNKLSEHFVPQKQLSAKQAFWLPILKPVFETPPVQSEPVLKDVNFLHLDCMEKSFLDEYSECVELKAELSKKNEMVKKAIYDELSKRCARMENRCILLGFTDLMRQKNKRMKQEELI